MAQEIKRGDIYWVDWNPSRGSEQSGLRPALVIQNDIGNKHSSTTIVAAMTTATEREFPFLVKVPVSESGLDRDSLVNLATILTIDKVRLRKKCGELSPHKMVEVDKAIKTSLGIS